MTKRLLIAWTGVGFLVVITQTGWLKTTKTTEIHFLNSFGGQKSKIKMFIVPCLQGSGIASKMLPPQPRSFRFSPNLLFISFIIFHLTFKSVICFEFIFVGARSVSTLFLHLNRQLFQHPLLKGNLFSTASSLCLCLKPVDCAPLLFGCFFQHSENKRRTDKDQTLWKINMTLNNLTPI